MISVSIQKKIVIPKIKSFLLERGFTHKYHGEDCFIKDENLRLLKLSFYFSTSGLSGNTLFNITFKEVEDIIYDVGLANNRLEFPNDKYRILSTVYDTETSYAFTDRPYQIGSFTDSKRIKIESKENLNEWIESFKEYINSKEGNFANQYSDIQSLMSKMNSLDNQSEKSYSKLLLGGIDHLFRALIISKLCNDLYYLEKQDRFDKIILREKYEKWHPYYERLKNILKDKAPLYNTTKI